MLSTVPILITARGIRSREKLLVAVSNDMANNDREGSKLETQRIASSHCNAGVRAPHVPRAAGGLRYRATALGWPQGSRNLTYATDDPKLGNFKRVRMEADGSINVNLTMTSTPQVCNSKTVRRPQRIEKLVLLSGSRYDYVADTLSHF